MAIVRMMTIGALAVYCLIPASVAAQEGQSEALPAEAQVDGQADEQATSPATTAPANGTEAEETLSEEEAKIAAMSPRERRRRARQLERSYIQLFQDENYAEAEPLIKEILLLDPQNVHIFNLGVLYYNWGKKVEALEEFERFLASEPTERGLIREARRFSDLIAKDVELIRRERAQAQEAVDRASAVQKQAEAAHAQALAALEDSRRQQAEAEADRNRWRRIALERPSGAGGGKRIAGASMLVAGGLALGLGAVYALESRSANNFLSDVAEWSVASDWLVGRADSYDQRALIFGLAGVGLVTAGTTLYYLGEREARRPLSESDLGIAPTVTPGPAGTTGVTVWGRF